MGRCAQALSTTAISRPEKPEAMTHSSTILLVEDEPMVRRLLVRHFARQNIAVVDVGDAESAIQAFRERAFDAVITDVHLPGMTGLDLALAIREIRPQQPVVFVTGDVDENLAQEALAHEGAGYLLKPFEFFELDAALRQALNAVPQPNAGWAPPSLDAPIAPAPHDSPPLAEWRVQQLRMLEAAAHQPVNLTLRAPRKRREFQLQVILRLGVAVALLVLIAWAIGNYLGAEREERPPADGAKQDAGKTIYVPYMSSEKDQSRTKEGKR